MEKMQAPCKNWTGYLFALGATMIWSGNFIVARGLSDSISPALLAFLRWSTATLFLLPLAGLSVWRERKLIRQNIGYLAVTAFLGVTVFNTLLYVAARSTTALNLSLIATSSPIFTLLFARILLGEQLTVRRLFGVAVAASGVVLLITRGDISLLIDARFSAGDLWMLLASMIFGAYSVLIMQKPRELGQSAFLLSTFGLGLLLLTPWAIVDAHYYGFPILSPTALGAVLYVGLGASLASFALWNKAVASVGPARSAFVYYTLPVFSGVNAYVLLGEPIGWVHGLSGMLIFVGILMASRSQ
jgi:drug/metabolite transporter (DMT)-like permease